MPGAGGGGADLPLNSRCRIPHHQQVSQTRKETRVSPGCKLFKSISKRAGKQGTDLLGPLQRNGVLLKVSVAPRTLISSRGDQPVEEQPPLSGVLCHPPSAARARCTTEPGRPMPRAGGGEIQSWASPRCELSHICVSCHHGLCEKRAALRCHPRLEATSRVCTWDSLVTCQAT